MISLGYTIAYFLRSGLPWQRTNSKNDHKGYHYDRIHAIKLQYPPRKLFAGFPDEFADYMTVRISIFCPSLILLFSIAKISNTMKSLITCIGEQFFVGYSRYVIINGISNTIGMLQRNETSIVLVR